MSLTAEESEIRGTLCELMFETEETVSTLFMACAYAIKNKKSLFEALEALNETVEVTLYDAEFFDDEGERCLEDRDFEIEEFMDDIEYGISLMHFASKCLSTLYPRVVRDFDLIMRLENLTDKD
jgi:hypothetical protein